MNWQIRSAGRLDEMSHGELSLRIEIENDGDIVLLIAKNGECIQDADGTNAKVEFCNTSGGGGQSPNTRTALVNLFKAILLDNQQDPAGIPEFPFWLKEAMEKEDGR